ncbi:hypothetical protein LTR78_000469 [Recurvomyces mirabilis]|uniref:3-hydroxyacyl-CoA dehydrogenase n=1 Tax=Recurvomyces mirabilis TaxID=574656 RepID=A0AAE0WXT0_9PEZI|nr:hypothetical protein LTR78_000469 [Recurvomyces mirabilis]KAK5162124.1 hypothetical protein LTS14_000470 [Recurvomyces mirabilis]
MTTQFQPGPASSLKGKVVVLTGGALGVGQSLVRLLHTAGAHVFFGDVLDSAGQSLEKDLDNPDGGDGPRVKFVPCDVTKYSDNVTLFQTAYELCGRVDHAIANAGLGEQGNMFDPALDLESVKQDPGKSMAVVDVNLKGPLYFARVASVYLRQPAREGGNDSKQDKSLTLVSSVAGFREDPGLYVYTASKHGVLGLMRSLRSSLAETQPNPIRTNAICPWMTTTRLVAGIEDIWKANDLPANSPEDVARTIVGVTSDGKVCGGTIYIEGGRAWNIEEGILGTRKEWLGESRERDLGKGTQLMGGGDHWTANKSSQV